MGIRDRLRRFENALKDHLKSFELLDGSRYYYDPMRAELFLHMCDCLRDHEKPERPEPPEILKALTRARDREAAYSELFGDAEWDMFPYDKDALIERGELEPRSLVVGYELGEPLPHRYE